LRYVLRDGGEWGDADTRKKTLIDLDNANTRLNQTLELLRNSIVDPAFNAPEPPSRRDGEEEAKDDGGVGESGYADSESSTTTARPRTLHDFVEEEGIEDLKTRLRHSIDYVQVRLRPGGGGGYYC
jgi:autophagy-related protein 17